MNDIFQLVVLTVVGQTEQSLFLKLMERVRYTVHSKEDLHVKEHSWSEGRIVFRYGSEPPLKFTVGVSGNRIIVGSPELNTVTGWLDNWKFVYTKEVLPGVFNRATAGAEFERLRTSGLSPEERTGLAEKVNNQICEWREIATKNEIGDLKVGL